MSQEVKLRVTLTKLRLIQSITKYARTLVLITFGKLSKAIPNPRFIKNKQANFYRSRLELSNKASQKALIKVFGMSSTGWQMEEIACQHIYVLSIKDNTQFVLSNSKVKLQYEVTVLKEYQDENLDDESKTQINLDTEKLSNGIFFQPTSLRRSATFDSNECKDRIIQFQNSSHRNVPLLSKQQFQQVHQTHSDYRPQRKSIQAQMSDDLWNNRSQINFIQPITHTPPLSRISLNKINTPQDYFNLNKNNRNTSILLQKLPIKNQQNRSNQKSKQQINYENNSVMYLIISITSFILGIIFKKL